MRNLTYDYISGYFFRRIEGNIHSSNPESMMPSISPYIIASGKLMAKMVVGADPCVCPDRAACALILIVPVSRPSTRFDRRSPPVPTSPLTTRMVVNETFDIQRLLASG